MAGAEYLRSGRGALGSLGVEPRPVRIIDGREFPVPGTWVIDAAHSAIEFSVAHMVISRVRGRVKTFSGTIEIPYDALSSSVQVSMDARSIDTGAIDERRADGTIANRDMDLRSARFLNTRSHPEMTFVSTRLMPGSGDRNWILEGALTIRGSTQPVRLDVAFVDAIPYRVAGGPTIETAVFSARTRLDRTIYGITTNWRMLEIGGWVIGNTIDVEIQLSARRRPKAEHAD